MPPGPSSSREGVGGHDDDNAQAFRCVSESSNVGKPGMLHYAMPESRGHGRGKGDGPCRPRRSAPATGSTRYPASRTSEASTGHVSSSIYNVVQLAVALRACTGGRCGCG